MRILIVCQYYYPDQFLINEIAETLVKKGNEVTVLTGLPNYPSGVIPKEYKRGQKRDEFINGVHVVRCGIIARGHNKVHLLLNYISFLVSATVKGKALNDEFDVVLSYQLTPITQVYPAIKYARNKGIKLFMYNCDLAPMSGENAIGKLGVKKLYAKISKIIMNAPDRIGVTSRSFIRYNNIINNVPINKMRYMPQHASEKMLKLDMQADDNGIADFMFAGNIAKGTNIDLLVLAAEELRKRGLEFRIHIVGDGSYLQTLKQLVDKHNLYKWFVFHGRFPMNEMPEVYKLADALLITLRKGQITVPSKLQTYMTTGKPIFGAMDGSGKEVIEEADCGACCEAGNYYELANNMESFILYPEKYEKCGENARAFFEDNFSINIYMNSLIEELTRLSH